ncbi:hypothetical protein Tco_0881735 [Tanacetum coccineum]
MDWEDVKDKEPKEAPVMGFDMGMDWEDADDEEPELIFPYDAEGSPYLPPLASSDTEPVMDIAGFHALRAAQETAHVENIRLRRELEEAQISNTLMCMGQDRAERELFRLGMDLMGYHEESGGQLSTSIRIMPPKMLKRRAVKKMVKRRVAKAIEDYEKSRANSDNARGSGSSNAGGTVNVQGCSHKTFMNRKPHPFNGTEGVVDLRLWIEKVEQVFEICKCAEEDNVMFVASTFEGRALTWWNRNLHTLGLVNAI